MNELDAFTTKNNADPVIVKPTETPPEPKPVKKAESPPEPKPTSEVVEDDDNESDLESEFYGAADD